MNKSQEILNRFFNEKMPTFTNDTTDTSTKNFYQKELKFTSSEKIEFVLKSEYSDLYINGIGKEWRRTNIVFLTNTQVMSLIKFLDKTSESNSEQKVNDLRITFEVLGEDNDKDYRLTVYNDNGVSNYTNIGLSFYKKELEEFKKELRNALNMM